jgi:hypothetical protein
MYTRHSGSKNVVFLYDSNASRDIEPSCFVLGLSSFSVSLTIYGEMLEYHTDRPHP